MEERKFKENDYVVVKKWDDLVEEFGMIDPESVREQMRNDEDCYWDEEKISAYNPEIINVPWGARRQMIDELVDMGLMRVKGYGEDGSVQLESDTYIDSIIPEEILLLVSEDEVRNYIFWLNKKDDDFQRPSYVFDRGDGLLDYMGITDTPINFIGEDRGDVLISYFYAASTLRTVDFNAGVTEYLSHKHEVGFYAFRGISSRRKSYLLVDTVEDSTEEGKENLISDWKDKGWEEVEVSHEEVFKIFSHPVQKGITIFLNGRQEDYKKNFEIYELIMQIISMVHGNTMEDVLDLVAKRDRTETMNAIRKIFSETDEQYKRIKKQIDIENFLKIAAEGQKTVLEKAVQSNQQRVDSYEANFREALNALKKSKERLFGYLHMRDDSQFEETREMLNMMGDDLSDFKCDREGKWFSFAIVQPLLYWDDEIYERLEDDDYFENKITSEMKSVFDKIFKTREYTLYLKQGVRIELNNNRPIALQDVVEEDKYMPNPHLYRYDCWGENKPNLTEAISNRDYMAIFSLVRSAIAGIALYDSAVMDTFCEYCDERFDDQKCIKVPGKDELISFDEACEMEA